LRPLRLRGSKIKNDKKLLLLHKTAILTKISDHFHGQKGSGNPVCRLSAGLYMDIHQPDGRDICILGCIQRGIQGTAHKQCSLTSLNFGND